MERPQRLDSGSARVWNEDVERRRREYHERRCADDALYRRAYERLQEEFRRMQELTDKSHAQIADAIRNGCSHHTSDTTANVERQPEKTLIDHYADTVRTYGQNSAADFGCCALAAGLLAMAFGDPKKMKQRMRELEEERPYIEEIRRANEAFDSEIIHMSEFEWKETGQQKGNDMEQEAIKILYQPLKTKWYRMIEAGVKTEEYREPTKYWCKRFTGFNFLLFSFRYGYCDINKTGYTHVQFSLGYPKKDDATRRMTFELKGIECREGREEWGAEKGKKYLVEVLGRRTTLDGTKLWED